MANSAQPKESSRLIRNIIYNYIGTAVVAVTGFFLFPFILHHLGNSLNGVWLLISSVIGYFGLLDLGITAAVTKMVAEESVKDRSGRRANQVLTNGLLLFSIIGLVILALGAVLIPFLGDIFKINPAFLGQTQQAYWLVLLAVGLTFPSGIISAYYIGFQDFKIQNLFVSAQTLINAAGTVWLLRSGHGIVALAVLNLAVLGLIFVAKIIVAKLKFRARLLAKPGFDRALVRSIFQFSKWFFVLNVAIQIVFNTDNVVLGIFASTVAISFYQVALKPNNFLRQLSGQLLTVVMPASAALEAGRDRERVQRLLLEATRVTSIVMLPAVIVLTAWGKDFIKIWVGPSYLSSYTTLIALAGGIFATSIQGASSQVIVALGKHRFLAIVAVFEALINLGVSIALVKPLGILGVAIGTTVPTAIVSICIAMPYAARLIDVSIWRLYQKAFAPLLPAALFLGLAVLFNRAYHFTNFGLLVIGAAILFALFTGLVLIADPQERRVYMSLLTGRLGRIKS